jgi:uncharacterized protein YjiK
LECGRLSYIFANTIRYMIQIPPMQKIISLVLFFATFSSAAQPPQAGYTINNISLPGELHKQVCISGMKYLDGKLYMASERCPVLLVVDTATGALVSSLNITVPQVFEMEGLTAYKGQLYLITENVAAVYAVNPVSGALTTVNTSQTLPPKSKSGDGMEGIAANEKNDKFYLLRERNEDMSRSQILTFSVQATTDGNIGLLYESTIELPLETPQWRYSDICFDATTNKLLCLKSFSKGKLRKQFIESLEINEKGELLTATLTNVPVTDFSEISNRYKDQDYSMNLEGITIDEKGTIYIVSDNTSGKAVCDAPAKEKTILLKLAKQ